MRAKKLASIVTAALVAISGVVLSGSQANAGSTTYPVEIAPNGDGACNTNTGGVSNVTHNSTNAPITIQCNLPNGLAWGRNLDTPDANGASATLVDNGTEVALGWIPGAMNSSHGRALGLGLKVGNTSVKNTTLSFIDPLDAATVDFAKSFDDVTNPQGQPVKSLRPNLGLKLHNVPWLQNGSARCKTSSEIAGVTWTSEASSVRGLRKYTPNVLIDCSSAGLLPIFSAQSVTSNMSNVSGTSKLMSGSYTCANGAAAIAGGYNIANSTTSQWPQIVYNGPDGVSTWKVVVAVPSQSSSAAQAVLTVFATCKS